MRMRMSLTDIYRYVPFYKLENFKKILDYFQEKECNDITFHVTSFVYLSPSQKVFIFSD